MRIALVLSLAASSCCPGPRPAATTPVRPAEPAPVTPSAELSPTLAPLGWWLGDWVSEDDKAHEHWVAAAGAIYGVGLNPNGFEVLVVDDGDGPGKPDGVLRLYAMPGGARGVEFVRSPPAALAAPPAGRSQRAVNDTSITFANDAHDYPKTITYLREGDALVAILGGGDRSDRFVFKRTAPQPAPELEAADIAFAAGTDERGIAGWLAAFEPEGWMMRNGEKVVGAEAITKAMGPLLLSGKLRWRPVASGSLGELGFTVGKATFTGAKPEGSWRSTYVTIWRRQPDGAWKVRFDTGRIVHD